MLKADLRVKLKLSHQRSLLQEKKGRHTLLSKRASKMAEDIADELFVLSMLKRKLERKRRYLLRKKC